MNLARYMKRKSSSEDSSFTVQQGTLMAAFFIALAVTLNAAQPVWWNDSGAVNASAGTNDYAVANQGQLKQFTQKAVSYMDANLHGGAGTTLDSMVSGWSNDYAANVYSSANPAPADFKAVNQGQLKYVGSLVWSRLVVAGYTNAAPSWMVRNTNTEYMVANIGQLKTVFNFDLKADSDHNNLPDWWEIEYFSSIGHDATLQSSAGDGYNLLQEYQLGRNPNDYYQGATPNISIVGNGNNQTVGIAAFAANPLTVQVSNVSGTLLVNAPVSFSIPSGASGGGLASANGGATSTTLSIRTTSQGLVSVYYEAPTSTGTVAITAIAGTSPHTAQVSFNEQISILSTLVAGGDLSFFSKSDGTLKGWGADGLGQLGLTAQTAVLTPTVVGTGTYLGVATWGQHTLFLHTDHTVWAVGENYFGQLGTGNHTDSATPLQISNLANIISVATGASHSLALQQNGTVLAWGGNYAGQLGLGTMTDTMTPTAGLTGVKAIAAGHGHSLALTREGNVYSWGDNSYGQLGNGTRTNSSVPNQVAGLSQIVAIAAGDYFSVAVQQGGDVYVWGANSSGQLALGHNNVISTPQMIGSVTNAASVAAGAEHLVIRGSDGSVMTSGANFSGQLGTGNTTVSNVLQSILSTGITGIASGFDHTLALRTDGSLLVFGANNSGQLGDGTLVNKTSPTVGGTP